MGGAAGHITSSGFEELELGGGDDWIVGAQLHCTTFANMHNVELVVRLLDDVVQPCGGFNSVWRHVLLES